MKSVHRVLASAVLLSCAGIAFAQQKASFVNGYPVAPTGLSDQPLGAGPFVYRTAEQQDVRVSVVARGLEYPYSLAFLLGGELLVTERAGRLRVIRNGVLDPRPVAGGPASRFAGKSGAVGAVHGYMSLAVHPRFAQN
ncbi:MAG: PQQ-dependent sugar dehydrogenase, partial [Gammaproteobacteria bacterium]